MTAPCSKNRSSPLAGQDAESRSLRCVMFLSHAACLRREEHLAGFRRRWLPWFGGPRRPLETALRFEAPQRARRRVVVDVDAALHARIGDLVDHDGGGQVGITVGVGAGDVPDRG